MASPIPESFKNLRAEGSRLTALIAKADMSMVVWYW
jgi:hypothetical protein